MITMAKIELIEPQADGRQYVTETQTDDVAGEFRFVYLADPGTDLGAIMAARTAALNEEAPSPAPPTPEALAVVSELVQGLSADQQLAVLEVAQLLAAGEISPGAVAGGSGGA